MVTHSTPPATRSSGPGTLFVDARDSTGVTLARTQSGPFTIQWEQLPPKFNNHLDIGKVGRSGAAWGHGVDGVSVGGAGADIWGTADAFHFAYTPIQTGDFNATFTIIGPVDGRHPWAKAGVMLRLSAMPGAPHHSVFMTGGNGVA